MLEGLLVSLAPSSLLAVLVGTLLGIIIGVLPGFTSTMGVALVLPFTFVLEPVTGLAMLGALYVAATFSDSVPAILVNTPGSPSAVATAIDGYPMALRGEGQRAIVASSVSSMFGNFGGGLTFLLIAAPLAAFALTFGPPEYFWMGIFALTLIGSIAGRSLAKGLIGGALGMLVGTIGLSMSGSVARYTFDIPELRAGVELVPALIGVFALPQVFELIAKRRANSQRTRFTKTPGVVSSVFKRMLSRPLNLIRSTVIGTGIGIMPGAGSSVASLVSYGEAKRWSKNKDDYGKGTVDGVVASESASNAAAAGSMIPTMGLGVPGSPAAAVILGALLLQGIQPGPQLLNTQPGLVYGFAFAILIAGIATFLVGTALSGTLAKIGDIPTRFLGPIIMVLAFLGAFSARNSVIDVFFMIGMGIIVYLLDKVGFHPGPIGLGVVLGPIVEPALVESLTMANASSIAEVFFMQPISVVLIVASIISIAWSVYSSWKTNNKRSKSPKQVAASELVEEGAGRAQEC